MTVYQLIYISATSEHYDDERLRTLLGVARAKNQPRNVTGFLVYHEGSFMQVLEGPRDQVTATFAQICRDPRHQDVTVLFEGEVEERSFDEWSMGFLPARRLADVPEGFHPFLTVGFHPDEESATTARRALTAFRDGRWRAALAAQEATEKAA
ncbi:MAG: BLUF domain-containing protein [Pseudomonadales bacterium]|nr:BLUF domain-containing protein [Pseudomonadales bacterium]